MSERRRQAMNLSPLLVDRDKGRQLLSGFPQRTAELKDLLGLVKVVAEQNETAEAIILEQALLFRAQLLAREADHDHLADFL